MENSTSNLQLILQADDLEKELVVKNLLHLRFEIDLLMREIGIARWSFLRAWCDDNKRPQDLDEDGLELLLERLCVRWADG